MTKKMKTSKINILLTLTCQRRMWLWIQTVKLIEFSQRIKMYCCKHSGYGKIRKSF